MESTITPNYSTSPLNETPKSNWVGQFMRFAVVGVINTGIDFLVLNILIAVTSITAGGGIIVLNAISFTAAVINSYFLNKLWAFKDRSHGHEGKKFSQFMIVSLIGIVINTGIVYVVTTLIPAPVDLLNSVSSILPVIGERLSDPGVFWANIAKIAATVIALMWNFVGYKFFVFKR